MSRYARNAAILAKIETTYGMDSTPTGAANAMLISNLSVNPLNSQNVSRDLMAPYLGGSEQLIGAAFLEASFDIELAGSGEAGIAPAWGSLLRACGFAEAITTSTRVDYTPITNAIESATIYYHDDGVLHKLLGARGTFDLKMGIGERPVLSFKFQGLDGGISSVSNPALTLTAFKTPLVVTDANTGDVTIGCSYSSGALVGGTAYVSRGLQLSMGNAVSFTPLLGGEAIDLTNREATGHIDLDLTAANEVTFMASVKANTKQGIGIIHGTTAGYKLLVHAPAAQLLNPSKQDVSGRRLIGYDLRLIPSAGNDELRFVSF